MRWTLLYYLLAFQLLSFQVFSAPTPPTSPSEWQPKPGDYVTVWHTPRYSTKVSTTCRHPGVILSLPQEGGAKVAVISHNHPDSKPQREIRDFDPDPHITGNVDLSPPMVVKTEIVPWPYKHSPMPAAGVEKLNKAILGKCYSPPSSNLHVVIWMHNCKAFKAYTRVAVTPTWKNWVIKYHVLICLQCRTRHHDPVEGLGPTWNDRSGTQLRDDTVKVSLTTKKRLGPTQWTDQKKRNPIEADAAVRRRRRRKRRKRLGPAWADRIRTRLRGMSIPGHRIQHKSNTTLASKDSSLVRSTMDILHLICSRNILYQQD